MCTLIKNVLMKIKGIFIFGAYACFGEVYDSNNKNLSIIQVGQEWSKISIFILTFKYFIKNILLLFFTK